MFARTLAPIPDPAPAPRLTAIARAAPPHRYDQPTLAAGLRTLWRHDRITRRIDRLCDSVQVGARNLALPMHEYPKLTDFGAANDAWIRVGTDLAAQALTEACATARITPRDIDALFFTTVTGLATPTIDARLINRLDLRRDLRRYPFFGLGCVGGAAGIARMNDYLRGHPDHTAALIAVELCSLTLQRTDPSVPNLIATGLFGDGAACVLATGATHHDTHTPAPQVIATQSAFYPDTERVMGWDIGAEGFKVVLSAGVPDVVARHIAPDVDNFLADHHLTRHDIDRWICHPGGPKVITALEAALDLPQDALDLTRRSLAEIGNLSSASVLHVLADHLEAHPPTGDGHAILMAMGPGFCAELVLLRW